jgi:metal-dependent amidase/aminoacylase/carboxypeptidase family protein
MQNAVPSNVVTDAAVTGGTAAVEAGQEAVSRATSQNDIDVSMEMNVDVGTVENVDDLEAELDVLTKNITDEALAELERRIKQTVGQ